jgi:hypothetical protein
MIFKHDKDVRLFSALHPILIMIFADAVYNFKEKFNKDLIVTDTVSTLEEDNKLKRRSPAHRQRRAIDVSVRNLDEAEINWLTWYLNNKDEYQRFKYMSTSGEFRLAYRHGEGDNDHIHIAIHARYAR